MKNFTKLALVSLLAIGSFSANADIVKGDWKQQGDRLSFADTETGIEWLALTETTNKSINQISALFDTTYKGWRLPTEDEVYTMMTHVFGDASKIPGVGEHDNIQKSDTYQFYSSFGKSWITQNSASTFYAYTSMGLHVSDDENKLLLTGVEYVDTKESRIRMLQSYGNVNLFDISSRYGGVYLVSDGGYTIASLNDPSINAMNANSPANVPIGFGGVFTLGLAFLVGSKRNKLA